MLFPYFIYNLGSSLCRVGGILFGMFASSHSGTKKVKTTKKSAKCLPILVALRPTNLETERIKFEAANYEYDPQFTYNRLDTKALEQYGSASDEFLPQVGCIYDLFD